MQRVHATIFYRAISAQRRHVLVLTLALCLWLVASAAHIHFGNDHAPSEPPTACSFCQSLPGSAAAPGDPQGHIEFVAAAAVAPQPVHAPPALDLPAGYRSRAPPLA